MTSTSFPKRVFVLFPTLQVGVVSFSSVHVLLFPSPSSPSSFLLIIINIINIIDYNDFRSAQLLSSQLSSQLSSALSSALSSQLPIGGDYKLQLTLPYRRPKIRQASA